MNTDKNADSPGLIAVVVAIVPIAFMVPPMFVLIPPLMMFGPAPLPQFMQFPAFMIRLTAVTSMTLYRPVKVVFFMCDTPLAMIGTLCVKSRYGAENENRRQNGNRQERFDGSMVGRHFGVIHVTPVFLSPTD